MNKFITRTTRHSSWLICVNRGLLPLAGADAVHGHGLLALLVKRKHLTLMAHDVRRCLEYLYLLNLPAHSLPTHFRCSYVHASVENHGHLPGRRQWLLAVN